MVINKFGDRLYSGLVETETAHLRGIAAKVHDPSMFLIYHPCSHESVKQGMVCSAGWAMAA